MNVLKGFKCLSFFFFTFFILLCIKNIWNEPISFLQSEKLNIVFILKKYHPETHYSSTVFISGLLSSLSIYKYLIAIIKSIHILL